MDFEKRLTRLEEIVEKMEGGEIPLEESLKLFEEGVKLTKDCHKQLSEAEIKVKQLLGIDSNGQPMTKAFSGEEA
jgi:exodeoxyribonuclease VII small subunit